MVLAPIKSMGAWPLLLLLLDQGAERAELQPGAGRAGRGPRGLVAVPIASRGSVCPTLPPLSDSLCRWEGPWVGWRAAGGWCGWEAPPWPGQWSLPEVRVSHPTKPRVASSTTSPRTRLPLARGSPLQLLLGQLCIPSAKPKWPQEQELLLGHRGKGAARRSK